MSDLDKVFSQTCVCGRTFIGLNTFTRHEKGCMKGKKRLSGALSRAKEMYWSKKARTEGPVEPDRTTESSQPSVHTCVGHRAEAGDLLATPTAETDLVCHQHLGLGCD